ncbi:hypothetical protein A9975_03735 [Cupriavidus sp. UME77]|nr:hypothetical protein [Cupriavidus sp. UME77]
MNQGATLRLVGDEIQLAVVLQRRSVGDFAPFAPGKDALEVLVGPYGTVRIEVASGHLGEPHIEVRQEDRGKGIGLGQRRDAALAQLLDQPVLQRAIHSLHAALGLAAVGAQALDIQLVQRAPELRMVSPCGDAFGIDPEDAGLVAVEGHRLSRPNSNVLSLARSECPV